MIKTLAIGISVLFFINTFPSVQAQEDIWRIFDFPKTQIMKIPDDLAEKWKPPELYQAAPIDSKMSPETMINRYREFLGLVPFIIDERLQKAAAKHALYLSKNRQKGLDVHTQVEGKPEYFGAIAKDRCKYFGYEGYCGDIIGWDDPSFFTSIELSMATPFHRPPLINPAEESLGCGSVKKWYICMMSMNVLEPPVKMDLVYPRQGQIIPGKFMVREYPPPYPEYFDKAVGPTISYRLVEPVSSLEYGLFNLGTGEAYDILMLDPATEVHTGGFFSFNPRKVISDGTEVLAIIRGVFQDGRNFEKYWSFSIGRAPTKPYVLPEKKAVKKERVLKKRRVRKKGWW